MEAGPIQIYSGNGGLGSTYQSSKLVIICWLQTHQKWLRIKRSLSPGDIVLLVDKLGPHNSSVLDRVIQVFPDKRGLVRRVKLKTKTSELINLSINMICLLVKQSDGVTDTVFVNMNVNFYLLY